MGVGPDGKVKIDIKPSGYVDFLAGYQGQKINNPTLPERARKNGVFDFNMNSQLQMDASIGEKLKLPINYIILFRFWIVFYRTSYKSCIIKIKCVFTLISVRIASSIN